MTTAREQQAEPASAGRQTRARETSAGRGLPDQASHGRDQEEAHRLAQAGQEITRVGDGGAEATARRADERAQAARSAWMRRQLEKLADRMHAADDALARQAGWTVTRTTGRPGFGSRTYRDPRFDQLRADRAGRRPG